MLILTFLDGQQRHMDNAEYLFFIGSLVPIAEWLFGLKKRVMMPKEVGDVLDQMTSIVRFWSFAILNNSIIAVQEKIPLYKVLKMLFRESAMDSEIVFQVAEKRLNRI